MAVALSDLALGPITGVDLSSRMLAAAREKGLYARLEEAELTGFLDRETGSWELILAADVLCYFGRLDDALASIAARLAPGGHAVISLEELDTAEEWRLGRLGRYAHSAAHVTTAAAAAGLRVARLQREALRLEMDVPVPGMIVTLEHAA